ncbi:ribokinase [Microbacterium sp.]|uniref:ribokinase n=1 Tax=Microbacterium sp. TaxID=51671 RepID=UPI0026391B5E|nr:ribokinase [Microbacterium sp.]
MTTHSDDLTDHSGAGVVVVGSITADVTTFSQRLPARGETVLGDDLTLVLGGKGANQAVASSLAGARTYLIGCVGTDPFRDLVVSALDGYGVDISHVREFEGATGVAHIRVDASGENDIVMVPLANSRLDAQHVDEAFSVLSSQVSVLLTQLEVPSETAYSAVSAGKAAGMTVVLDPAPVVELDPQIWRSIDIVTPNETEASLLTGIPVTDLDSAIRAGQWFCARGTNNALITMASTGAVLVNAQGATQFEPFAVQSVDTTAAGDAFAGYLAAGLAEGFELSDAITRGMAAGALAVTKRGASPSLPQRASVDALVAHADSDLS